MQDNEENILGGISTFLYVCLLQRKLTFSELCCMPGISELIFMTSLRQHFNSTCLRRKWRFSDAAPCPSLCNWYTLHSNLSPVSLLSSSLATFLNIRFNKHSNQSNYGSIVLAIIL